MKILAIGAHPDDIEISMFGLLAACKERGDDIHLIIATDGALGGKQTGIKLSEIRAKETCLALKEIGIPVFLNLPDGGLSNCLDAQKKIDKEINHIKPDLIITHSTEDYHPDHSALSYYVKNTSGFQYPVIFSETFVGHQFEPNIFIDITRFFASKKKAIMCHKSQQPQRYLYIAQAINRFRAVQCNALNNNYAEAYRFDIKFPFCDVRYMLPNPPNVNSHKP